MKSPQKSPLDEATLVKTFEDVEKNKHTAPVPETYPLVEIQSGPKQGAWFTLTQQKETSIGRANVNSIVLEDNSVSRSHSVIYLSEGQYYVKDVGSRNGTFVNDKKVQEQSLLKHGDRIKTGIYVLRFLTQPEEAFPDDLSEEFLETSIGKILPEEKAQPPKETPPPELPITSPVASEDLKREESNPALQLSIPEEKALEESPPKSTQKLRSISLVLVSLILVGGLGFTFYRFYIKKKFIVAKKVEVSPPKTEIIPPTPPPAVAVEPPAETQPSALTTPAAGVPVFLEVNAQPLQARIFYQGKDLGLTPFKANVSVPVGVPQELIAIYRFEEFGQEFSEKQSFVVSQQDDLISVNFVGSVGALKIKNLPKDVQLYLEGSFASADLKSKTAKLTEVNYTRPVYLPFGKYTLEMKRAEKLEGSDTVVDVVKYHYEFALSKESPEYELSTSDQDLAVFPAKIKTNPAGAEVIVDGKKYGETPFEGNLPQGSHQLVLKKDGYYNDELPLTMTMNTLFEREVTLRTSEAGEYINKGRNLIRQGQYQQAIEPLAESLKHNPSPYEIGQVQILLGNAYIKTGAYDVALGYFEKAKLNTQFKGQANLGIAEANFKAGNNEVALARAIDVMLNETDNKIKSEAEALFHKMSPLKSVILVSSEPSAAKVTLNGQEVSQVTPLILSDLSLGSYRLSIEKDGYKRYESRIQLALSTFKPVVVKLEPLP